MIKFISKTNDEIRFVGDDCVFTFLAGSTDMHDSCGPGPILLHKVTLMGINYGLWRDIDIDYITMDGKRVDGFKDKTFVKMAAGKYVFIEDGVSQETRLLNLMTMKSYRVCKEIVDLSMSGGVLQVGPDSDLELKTVMGVTSLPLSPLSCRIDGKRIFSDIGDSLCVFKGIAYKYANGVVLATQ